MPYIRLLAPRGEYPIGKLLRIIQSDDEPGPDTIEEQAAKDVVEKFGQANYVDDIEAEAEAAPAAPAAEPQAADSKLETDSPEPRGRAGRAKPTKG